MLIRPIRKRFKVIKDKWVNMDIINLMEHIKVKNGELFNCIGSGKMNGFHKRFIWAETFPKKKNHFFSLLLFLILMSPDPV